MNHLRLFQLLGSLESLLVRHLRHHAHTDLAVRLVEVVDSAEELLRIEPEAVAIWPILYLWQPAACSLPDPVTVQGGKIHNFITALF